MTKKLLNIALFLTIGLFALSCSNKWTYYTPTDADGKKVDGVSWAAESVTYAMTSDNAPIVVNINRAVANDEVTIDYQFTDLTGEDVFVGNTSGSVTFAKGEYQKSINVTYNYDLLAPGVDYIFNMIITNTSQSTPVAITTFEGVGKKLLEYEDYMDAAYDQYAVVDLNKMAFDYIDGAIIPVTDTPKLQKAKGTEDYYKLKFFNTVELEFQNMNTGSAATAIKVAKFTGYNEPLIVTSTAIQWNVVIDGDTYAFDYRFTYLSLSVTSKEIKSGDYIRQGGWLRKNGAYYYNSYNTYQWIDFV